MRVQFLNKIIIKAQFIVLVFNLLFLGVDIHSFSFSKLCIIISIGIYLLHSSRYFNAVPKMAFIHVFYFVFSVHSQKSLSEL